MSATAADYPRWVEALRSCAHRFRLSTFGLLVAGLVAWTSFMPSLLPRTWYFQGIVTGVSLFVGYGLGVLVRAVHLRWVAPQVSLGPTWTARGDVVLRWSRRLVPWFIVVYVVTGSISAIRWQEQSARLVDSSPQACLLYPGIPVVALALFLGLLYGARGLRAVFRAAARAGGRRLRLPDGLARVAAFVLVVVLAMGLGQGVVLRALFEGANHVFRLQNDERERGVIQPPEPERSGSPLSLAAFDDLGLQGRRFVSGGLRGEELSSLLGTHAEEPIRLYAGLETAPTDAERAQLVVAELDRTRAWERGSVIVVPTTGTGWINGNASQAMELLGAGDTAIVGMQYSFLPSWISFVGDRDKARAAGAALVDAVAEWRDALPEGTPRPKLYVYGESLGVLAGEAAFSGLRDIRATTDGVLWVGPPHASEIWRSLVERRDPGSREVEPVYAGGLLARFTEDPAEFRGMPPGADRHSAPPPGTDDEWLEPRILYVQHATDPVVWWTPDLLFRRPDWLTEQPGDGRHRDMTYLPVVTFWQVTADLGNAVGGAEGYGHLYDGEILDGWATVTGVPGWDDEKAEHFADLQARAMEGQRRG